MPDLVESLGGDATTERLTIERLITRGDARDWLRYLRERTDMLAASIDTHGSTPDAALLAAILHDQYLLALGVSELASEDTQAMTRLERLEAQTG